MRKPMFEAKLKSSIWVGAYRRQCELRHVPCMVVARGDDSAGAVLLKLNGLDGRVVVLGQATAIDGRRIWRALTGPTPVAESGADALIARERARDPDIWVLEIEDPRMEFALEDPIEGLEG